ncbi:hypothetical protein JTE90_016289 [Oedothorax gibbosus]|uniref:Uncharacterized protein n=1 Tax=Oedothorax gibbosus TaxID=931172 RepID=A0AAV6U2A2_9ARAC|nr:hypothetical protein JTE90_016289 [Oedothorax gibbosus]
MIYTFAFHFSSSVAILGSLCVLWLCEFYLLLWLGSLAASVACLLYVSYQVGSFLDNFLSRFRVKSANKAVFITGM